jgi:hypothetical protein
MEKSRSPEEKNHGRMLPEASNTISPARVKKVSQNLIKKPHKVHMDIAVIVSKNRFVSAEGVARKLLHEENKNPLTPFEIYTVARMLYHMVHDGWLTYDNGFTTNSQTLVLFSVV